jgi:DNA-binding response OmpR family regulator
VPGVHIQIEDDISYSGDGKYPDDYLSKPYDMGELMARIRALLRP